MMPWGDHSTANDRTDPKPGLAGHIRTLSGTPKRANTLLVTSTCLTHRRSKNGRLALSVLYVPVSSPG